MSDTTTKTIHLALQGGGAHGAFTWGVLDALLADGRLNFAGISGTKDGLPQLPDGEFQPGMPLNCVEEFVAGKIKEKFNGTHPQQDPHRR